MKQIEKEQLIKEQREKICHLDDSLKGAKLSLLYMESRIKELVEEIEKLKQEKADLLNENVRLLEKMRDILKAEVEKDGN